MPSNKKLLQAAAGSAGGDSLYVENVFSTFLYDGNSSTNVITNGIDLAGEGGLVWGKSRDNAFSHMLIDTVRGGDKGLSSNASSAEYDNNTMITSFNSNGFTLGSYLGLNYNGDDVASWTFRKAEKFFDVVTYTGNGTAGRTVAHNLGSVPGMIVVKKTSGSAQWPVYHGSRGIGKELFLNKTDAETAYGDLWSGVTSTNFTVSNNNQVNNNGDTYVAYLFASDAGGFGDDSDENIIKCGSYTGNGSIDGPTVTLGFEPQWIMIKGASVSSDWTIFDIMRGLPVGENDTRLWANGAFTENNTQKFIDVQATGFKLQGQTSTASNGSGSTYIYMALRRPMKTPESGTEVLSTVAYTGTGADKFLTSSSVVDLAFNKKRTSGDWTWTGRLQGAGRKLVSNGDFSEGTDSSGIKGLDYNNGVLLGGNGDVNGNGDTYISYMLSRATGAFDVVAYTGNGASSHAITHNLGVSPELIITKRRDANGDWRTATNFSASAYSLYKVNAQDPATNINYAAYGMYAAKPTATNFTVGSGANVNASSGTYVSYLFGTVEGVSKVGSVVHSGTTNVDCGFSAGARFVMAKRADQNSGWFIWDSVRGIVSGDDPYVRWNVSSAEVTNTDYIDPLSSGFTLTSSLTAGTYIFLAIA